MLLLGVCLGVWLDWESGITQRFYEHSAVSFLIMCLLFQLKDKTYALLTVSFAELAMQLVFILANIVQTGN